MNIEKINQLREFCEWVRLNTDKSVNFSINVWYHIGELKESIEYSIWVDDLISKKSKDIDVLVNSIPKLKDFCRIYMDVK